jgi:hypothetical protein
LGKPKVELISEFPVANESIVKICKQGDIVKVSYVSHKNEVCPIINIDADHYQVRRTGEIREKVHSINRSGNMKSVLRSLKKLRALINTNCSVNDFYKCRWVTLTYRQENGEPMTNSKQLYADFDKFIKRFRYFCNKRNYGELEYIAVAEPQGTGAWHMHVIFIFNKKAPFIDNDTEFAPIWGHGYTKIQSLEKVAGGKLDNPGAYLTAYLADMELNEAFDVHGIGIDGSELKEAKVYDEQSKKWIAKRIVKGARLSLYPNNLHLYRSTRGLKEPVEYETTWKKAKKEISGGTLTSSKNKKIENNGFSLTTSNMYFNMKRESNQGIYEHDLVDFDTGTILVEKFDF